jgi:UDP-N-acetylmuramate dehydrogenase
VRGYCKRFAVQIRRAESLRAFNTLGLEATASALAFVESVPELEEALAWSRAEGLPVVALGEGSNIVLAGSPEVLWLRQTGREISALDEEGSQVVLRVDAGHNWHQLVRDMLRRGYHGLENLALIPGTVGAAPIQNIGAYGVEVEQFIRAVHGVELASGKRFQLDASECNFAYRDSIFKGELRDQYVITAVDLALDREPAVELSYPALAQELASRGCANPRPRDVYEAVVAVRRRRLPDPLQEPNAGSFFKNPVVDAGLAQGLAARWPDIPRYDQPEGRVKLPAAWLIDRAGWKGHSRAGVGVHPKHALVLVNLGANSGEALLALADDIVASVQRMFGIALEMEPRVYGR